MKVWLLIISLISATFLIKNVESVSQNGERPKLNKTFDEIFGKGWDAEVPEFTETKDWHKMAEVENKSTDQDNPNEQSFSDHFESFVNKKIRERFDEMFDEKIGRKMTMNLLKKMKLIQKISISSLIKWKAQFKEEIKNL